MSDYANLNQCVDFAWLAFVAVWLLAALFAKRIAVRPPISALAIQRIQMMLALILLFVPKVRMGPLDRRFLPPSTATALAGLVVTILGIAGAFWARFYLGRNWSPDPAIKRDHELVEAGPYAFARHPIYSGILLAFLGTAIARAEVRSLVAVAVATFAFFQKARLEERLMARQFGAGYLDYMRRVKMLVPFVW